MADIEYTPFSDIQAMNDAQSALLNLTLLPGASTTPYCTSTSNSNIPGASVTLIPTAYCACGYSYASAYSTANATTNPCPFTNPPGPTITLAYWFAQFPDRLPCTFPSTTSCASYAHKRRGTPVETGLPQEEEKDAQPVCFGTCPKPNPNDPPPSAETCT